MVCVASALAQADVCDERQKLGECRRNRRFPHVNVNKVDARLMPRVPRNAERFVYELLGELRAESDRLFVAAHKGLERQRVN